MANQGKHKKSTVLDWMEGEDETVPTKSRGSHVVDSYIKKSKVALKRSSRPAAASVPEKPEAALLREPAPQPKIDLKHSQAASWERQRRLERLPQLRAPYQYKGR
jgi:hypothetical protein